MSLVSQARVSCSNAIACFSVLTRVGNGNLCCLSVYRVVALYLKSANFLLLEQFKSGIQILYYLHSHSLVHHQVPDCKGLVSSVFVCFQPSNRKLMWVYKHQ